MTDKHRIWKSIISVYSIENRHEGNKYSFNFSEMRLLTQSILSYNFLMILRRKCQSTITVYDETLFFSVLQFKVGM